MGKSFLERVGVFKSEEEPQVSNKLEVKTFDRPTRDEEINLRPDVWKTEPNNIEKTIMDVSGSLKESENSSSIPDVLLNQLREIYSSEFVKLNKPDVDFFELFHAVSKSGDLSSSDALKMAYGMCTAMNSSLTKDSLLSQGDQYAKAMMDSYTSTKSKGESKLLELKEECSNRGKELERAIQQYEDELAAKREELSNLNQEYNPKILEVSNKIKANNIAYSELSDKILALQKNIKNNL